MNTNSDVEETENPKKPKRVRLSLACNQCRKRKVKCDAEMPQCKNCRIRGLECITTDPRNPELVVYRKPPAHAVHSTSSNSPSHSATTSVFSPVADLTKTSSHDRNGLRTVVTTSEESRLRYSGGQTDLRDDSLEKNGLQDERHGPIALNRVGTRHQRKLMGSSSLQSLVMVLDMCLEKFGQPSIAPMFRHGMHHAEEFALPLQVEILHLPSPALVDLFLTKFDEKVRPIMPIIDIYHIRDKIRYLTTLQETAALSPEQQPHLRNSLQPLDIPFLACAYAVLSLGADEAHGGVSELGSQLLTAAYALYAHLSCMPYVASVQALVLMALALRARAKDGQASLLLGHAIRIAQSIGLHRNANKAGIDTPEESSQGLPGDDIQVRIWWICFSLEKIFELETTRPTAAHRIDCDQPLPTLTTSSFPFYVHLVSLSLVLGQISDTLFRAKRERGSATTFLRNVLALDEALSQWYVTVPEYIRPGSLFCDDSEMHLAMYLSQQYHEAVITLHRAALSIPYQEYTMEVEKLQLQSNTGFAAKQRLKKGADLCLQAAKAIVNVDVEVADTSIYSTLYTISPSLLASVVIALQIIRQPKSRMVSSDLEMLSNETLHIEERYRAAGQNEDFIRICSVLRTSMHEYINLLQSTQPGNRAKVGAGSNEMLTPSSCISAANPQELSWDAEHSTAQGGNLGYVDPFQSVAFEDFWMAFDPFPGESMLCADTFDV